MRQARSHGSWLSVASLPTLSEATQGPAVSRWGFCKAKLCPAKALIVPRLIGTAVPKSKSRRAHARARRLWQFQPYMLDFFIFFACFLVTFLFIALPASNLPSELWVVVAWPGG